MVKNSGRWRAKQPVGFGKEAGTQDQIQRSVYVGQKGLEWQKCVGVSLHALLLPSLWSCRRKLRTANPILNTRAARQQEFSIPRMTRKCASKCSVLADLAFFQWNCNWSCISWERWPFSGATALQILFLILKTVSIGRAQTIPQEIHLAVELKKHFIRGTNNLYNNNRERQCFRQFMLGGVDTDAFFLQYMLL